jgi:L-malate glycosyltransferase
MSAEYAPRKRVLFLAKYLDSGGVTTHMMTLAQALTKQGWDVGVISGGTFGQHALGPEWFESQGVQHFRLAYDTRNPLTLFAQALKTLRVVLQFKPDLLHVHWRITSAFAQLVQKVLRIPFVSTIHLLGIGEGRFHQLFSYWGQRTIAISSECRDYLESSFHLAPGNIDLIFNGADAHYFRIPSAGERNQTRAMFGATDESCVISLTGRLEEVKGHAVLLNAIASLIKHNSNIELLFAGEGSQKANLLSLAQKLGIEQHVHFLGHTDAREVLWASDISVLPSFKEGFPLSTVESMLCGVVTVRSNTSGAADIITHGETGFIVPTGDVEALRDYLTQLVNAPKLRKALSENARLRALELFTSETMATLTVSTYERALAQSARPK